MKAGPLMPLVAMLAWPGAPAAAADGVRVEDPPAFGYRVGDVFERRVVVSLPAGWHLDPASLPRPGGRGRAIELRSIARRDSGSTITLVLHYQVMTSPDSVRVLEVPPWRLRVQGGGRSDEWRVEAVPVAVAPLVPAEAPAREGFGPLRPDHAAPAVDTGPFDTRLAVGAATGAAAWLAWLGMALSERWAGARRRPFAHAWRQVRRLPAQPAADQWRAALRQLHEALNRAAGQVLFDPGLAAFVAARQGFTGLEPDLRRFLALSRAEFFEGRPAPADAAAWLKEVSRRLRDAERSGA